MKHGTSFMKRCLAAAVALVMIISCANLGLVQQALAADKTSVTIAEIIAKNYDLSVAEEDLLNSGYLASDSFEYTVPSNEDGLVSVDTENAKITAQSKNGWNPVKAVIVYGGNKLEVALTEGVGTYDPAVVGNAFSVEVTYELNTEVSEDAQNKLLGAAASLKQGVANLEAVKGQAGNLFILEQALPTLNDLAINGMVIFGNVVEIERADVKAAIIALYNDMAANNNVLPLSDMITAYEAGAQTAYLFANGAAMQAEVVEVAANVKLVDEWLDEFSALLNLLDDASMKQQIKNLSGVINNMDNALAAVAADAWTAANDASMLAEQVDFAKLDELVAALGEATAVTVKNPLNVAATTLKANLAMWNVTYVVALNHVVNNEIVEAYQAQQVETLADGAAAAEVLAAFEGFEAQLLGQWADVYVEGKFVRSADGMPETLTGDLTYVVIYNPMNFTVDVAGEINEYPYGYKLVLPAHADPAKSYDYRDANGTYYPQGSVVTVTEDMTFTREEGKSYTSAKLFEIISKNVGNAKITAILTSGAVKGDEVINYREPSEGELESLVVLDEDTLKVQSYASSYAGLNWAPYSYVVDGVEKLFNGENEVVLTGDFTTVSVYYRLTMTNHTEAEVAEILALVSELVEEAEGQKSVMDRLAGFEGQLAQINKNMLNGLNGVIGGYSTENGGGLNDDPKVNDELVAFFQETIAALVKNCCEGQDLRLNNIIKAYNDPNNGGLTYYYQNDAVVRNEIAILSDYLNAMLDNGPRQAALEKLMAENGYSDKVEVLESLGEKLATIKADLAPVNASIDTTDAAKLSALAKALATEGSVEVASCESPYIQMGPVNRVAERFINVEVTAVIGGEKFTTFVTIEKNTALTAEQVNTLVADMMAFVEDTVDVRFYDSDFDAAELNDLVGVALEKNTSFTYTWTPKEFVVKIEGEADQIVTINSLTINLPAHPNAEFGLSYEYTIGSTTANSGIYTFKANDLLELFEDGVLVITRVEHNANVEALEKMVSNINIKMGFQALKLVSKNGVYTGIEANIAAGDLMNLMMGLVLDSGYGYIGLNGEGFIYSNEKAELELSMQTLINAMLNDEDFSNETIIALGEKGNGKILSASMQLGDSAEALKYSALTFTLNLNSVPSQLVSATGYIKTISKYITFHSENGALAVEVNLPDQVYAAYAAALVATGNVEKDNVNGLKQQVAVQFLYDYLTAITGSDMDLETFTNTMEMLGINRSLTSYNKYYDSALAAYNKHISVTIGEELTAIATTAPGQKSIDALLSVAGIDKASLSTYLGMIKEYKNGAEIKIDFTGKLLNPDKTYYALIIDAQANGVTNKVEAPTSVSALNAETSTLAGYSAIILTANVDGDLTISGNTVLDLNGFDITGNIHAAGKLFIIDSTMDTYNAGTVGGVTGNAVILAGNYNSDVSSLLKDGYYMDGTTVRNALYTIVETTTMAANGEKTLTFVLNTDVYEDEHVSGYLPEAKALAVDIATDLLLNYFTTAKLSVAGHELIAVDVDDLVGLYAGDNRVNKLAKNLIACFNIGEAGYENNVGFEALVNEILADLIDFAAITEALDNNTALFTYEITTEPWLIEIDHNTEEDYATIDVRSNPELAKTFNVALVVEGKFNDNVSAMTGILADVVVADETEIMVDIPTPTYSDKTLSIYGAGKANVVVDMSHNTDYVTVIGVVLANGNPAKADAIAAALNNGDMAAMKKIIDNTSVAEIFTALKKLARNVDFKAMAQKVGVNVSDNAAKIEGAFHLVLCAAGKALEELDITGMNSKLGGLYNDETGYYELSKADIFRDVEVSARGYTALVELGATELSLKVKLFATEDDTCLWGDANHDGKVNALDATLVLQYSVGTLDADQDFCTVRTDVNDDGKINALDATLILQHSVGTITKFPAEN